MMKERLDLKERPEQARSEAIRTALEREVSWDNCSAVPSSLGSTQRPMSRSYVLTPLTIADYLRDTRCPQ